MPKSKKSQRSSTPIRLGFVALADSAPLAMAQELGLFAEYGIDVELHREVGWATIRDKIIYGELDAAQAPAGLVVAASCGLGSIRCECLTGLVLNRHGDAITLSEKLWKRGVRDGVTLRAEVERGGEPLIFGVVHPYSSHSFLLRNWLRTHGIEPDRDVRIVVVPPPQMPTNLKAGHLDGFCVGEPWNSMAILAKTGWCAAVSSEIAPRHPEKVLMVRAQFAERAEREHLAMISALLDACRFCDAPENRERITETLAQPHYLNVPIRALQTSLRGPFSFGHERAEKVPDFHIFSRDEANEPNQEVADWVISNIHASGLLRDPSDVPADQGPTWFRTDIFHQATQLARPAKS